jgi:hypothetical protein
VAEGLFLHRVPLLYYFPFKEWTNNLSFSEKEKGEEKVEE